MNSHKRNLKFSFDFPGRRQAVRWLLPIFLILLFLTTLLWLPWQAQKMESNERQEQLIADTLWVEQAIHFQLSSDEESLRLIASEVASGYLTGPRLRERLAQNAVQEKLTAHWIDHCAANPAVKRAAV